MPYFPETMAHDECWSGEAPTVERAIVSLKQLFSITVCSMNNHSRYAICSGIIMLCMHDYMAVVVL